MSNVEGVLLIVFILFLGRPTLKSRLLNSHVLPQKYFFKIMFSCLPLNWIGQWLTATILDEPELLLLFSLFYGIFVQSAWGDPMRNCSWILLWKTTTHKTGLTSRRKNISIIQYFIIKNHCFDMYMFRPVLNESMPIEITFGINLQQIVDLVIALKR